MRTTLELLELLRDKGRDRYYVNHIGICDWNKLLCFKGMISREEYVSVGCYLLENLPSHQRGDYAFDSETERYAWLDKQIEKLKQEEK